MSQITLITFMFFVISHVAICEKQSACNGNFFENQFLSNLDKLLNLSHVKVASGMTLKKKDTLLNRVELNGNTCENNSWIEKIDGRIKRMMNTHVLEFDLASVVKPEDASPETPRRRRHQQQQAISMMLMGISLFLMVFVPMGFNFLSALGGKAFLMAKLALLLASVNGLKRVANGGVHYGLYQTPPEPSLPGMHHYGYDRFDRPRRNSLI